MVIQCLHWMATNESVGSATLILLGSSPTGATVAPAFTAHGDPMPSLNGHQWGCWQCHSDPVRELPNSGHSGTCLHCSRWSNAFTEWPPMRVLAVPLWSCKGAPQLGPQWHLPSLLMVIQCLHWMATNEGVGSATLILLGSSPTRVTVAPAFTAHCDPMPSLNGHQWECWQCHSDPVRELPNSGHSGTCLHCSWWSNAFTEWPPMRVLAVPLWSC